MALSAPPASATDTTPTFSGTAGTLAGDASTITVRVHSGSAVTGALMQTLSAARGAGGAYSVDAAALAPGTYTARAEQCDSAGNTGYSPTGRSRSPAPSGSDTAAPVVSLSLPEHGSSLLVPSVTFAGLTGGVAGDSALITVRLYAGSGVSGTLLSSITTPRLSGNWFSVASPTLASGTYTARAEQSDDAGNTGYSAPATFTIASPAAAVAVVAAAMSRRPWCR